MSTATLRLSTPGARSYITTTVSARGPQHLGRAAAQAIRAFAQRRGVSPMAVDYAISIRRGA